MKKTMCNPIFPNKLSPAVKAAARTAFETGQKIVGGEFRNGEEKNGGAEKGDELGHHAIVTPDDIGAQNHILSKLSYRFPEARFITEEKTEGFKEKIITDGRLNDFKRGLTFGVDPADGTSQLRNNLYEYSVSVGVAENGGHIGGAIYAPEVRGGFLVYGEKEKGVYLLERESLMPERVGIINSDLNKSVVYIGPDVFFLKQYSKFLVQFSRQVRTTNCNGSGALALALLASGRIDAVVQPVQCPWDWFAGYPLVEEAGGKFQFYHYREGLPVKMEKPDLASYSSKRHNTAFIAGNSAIVDWLFELLATNWVL